MADKLSKHTDEIERNMEGYKFIDNVNLRADIQNACEIKISGKKIKLLLRKCQKHVPKSLITAGETR